MTKLANAAAHEINNPLTVVGGNIHLLAARIADRPELQRYIDRVLRAVQTIADMALVQALFLQRYAAATAS